MAVDITIGGLNGYHWRGTILDVILQYPEPGHTT